MAVDVPASQKEVLEFLVRVSQLAGKALENLNHGNPYDAIRLIRAIAGLDTAALNVLANVKNYEAAVKPYHLALVAECKGILALSSEALQTLSQDLKDWSEDKLAKYAALFQGLLKELDKELSAEKELTYWLSQAKWAFLSQEKAWTYSRVHLERALDVLNSLVRDENAIGQTIDRFVRLSKGVKHPNLQQFLKDLLSKRIRVMEVVKFILENAFKDSFNFRHGHNWHSELVKISDLPAENIKELEAMREQLVGNTVLMKGNVNYFKIRKLLTQLVALSQHAIKVERAIEIAEEKGKEEEEIMKEYWERHVHGSFVYHGTSSIFLPNIERFGLSSEQIFSEGTPFRPEDYEFFLEISRKAHGADAPHLKYFTQNVTQGFFLEANHNFAVNYAKQGPERIRFMLEHIRDIENEFRRGVFQGRVSQQEVSRLLEILRRYEQIMSHHKPVVLHIPMSSPALLAVLNQNGQMEALAAKIIANYEAFKQYVLNEFTSALQAARQEGENLNVTLSYYLEKFSPLNRFFHNRPLRGTIPWSSITKAEYV